MSKLTPMMQQYMKIKKQYKDTLLFFRLGDFYELFFEDAETASRELEITLTGRDCGLENRAPMCGVPYHSVDGYIDKLITKGYKVAICEQVEDPSQAKGIVERDVVRIITPGTLIDTQLLDEKKNNYLMSLYGCSRGWGLSYVDISTGELFSTEITGENTEQKMVDEISKIQPSEVIYYVEENERQEELMGMMKKKLQLHINSYDSWCFEEEYALSQLKDHFHVLSMDGLGLTSKHLGIQSTGALIDYLRATQKRFLGHINKINVYSVNESMVLDLTTRRNLELTETIRGKSKKGSLLWVLDKTQTSMGGRLLRKWVEQPLLDVKMIQSRLEAVGTLKEDILFRKELKDHLKNIYDLERLSAKVAYGSANPRDLVALKNSLRHVPVIKEMLKSQKSSLLLLIYHDLDPLKDIEELIERAIVEEPPTAVKEGGIIKTGYNHEVDELQKASKEGKCWIAALEREEKEKTGIKSLKVGFNKVFGYYIEVTKSNIQMVPDHYIRKQTLANCERYITPELKEMESKILGAEEKIVQLEYELFVEIRDFIAKEVQRIQKTARGIAVLDVIYSLAEVASENNYVKPEVNNGSSITIRSGRHPVVEKMLEGEMFIDNDTYIDQSNHEISVITGPNMAGKSTYMRQVALIVLMAQIGSFAPASEAAIGVVDRIFTRVGASDDLSQGQSTFMVEMSELANILNCATTKSLLVLDEIGRGTSTYDGLSIAWAVIEYISKNVKAKTLFSTHYHELTELEGRIRGVKNYRIEVKEDGENIIFLRKVTEGSADKSYGIHVASLAGLPRDVIIRANEILLRLEESDITKVSETNGGFRRAEIAATRVEEPKQMDFSVLVEGEIIEEIKKMNLLEMTPIDALNTLYRLQKKLNDL